MKTYLFSFTLFIIFYVSESKDTGNTFQDDYSDYNEHIYRKYIMMDKQLKLIAEQSVKRLLPYILEANEHTNLSSNCARNIFGLINGFRRLKSWSFNFLDAMGKLQSGANVGNLEMFGEYEECIETTVRKNEKIDFQGQYCLLKCKLHLPKVHKIPGVNDRLEGLVNATKNTSDIMKLIVSKAHFFYSTQVKVGICVPSGCTEEDISQIVKYSIGEFINATLSHCLKKGDVYYWINLRIFIVSGFVLLGIIIVASTLLDNTIESWKNNELGHISRIFQCFSLTRNFPKLMSTDVPEKSVTCFYGIRVLTIFWIILAHEFIIYATSGAINHTVNLEKIPGNFFSQILLNGLISIDILFFSSGFFNSYSRMLIKKEERSQPGIMKIIVQKLWRIYPAFIAAFILMCLLVIPQAHIYANQVELYEKCRKKWWLNFLFIGNFFSPSEMCMTHAWYVCVEMQLFLLSLFTVPLLLRKPKEGIILHIGIIFIVNICSMSWWLVDDLPPALIDATSIEKRRAIKRGHIYILPVVHLGSYFIGIILGYIAATKKQIKITKVFQFLGWLVSSLGFISMIFMTYTWNSGNPYTELESSFYGAWSRTITVLGFAWLVFCCFTGHGGLINYILSLKLWIPLSRISYVIYLVTPSIQSHYWGHQSFPVDFSNVNFIWNYFSTLSISILISFAVALTFERPVIAMAKMLYRRKEVKSESAFDLSQEISSNSIKDGELSENGKFTSLTL